MPRHEVLSLTRGEVIPKPVVEGCPNHRRIRPRYRGDRRVGGKAVQVEEALAGVCSGCSSSGVSDEPKVLRDGRRRLVQLRGQ